MALSLRLETLVQAISPCGTVLDIGCDHGLLEAALIERGIAKQMIAADVSRDSLAKAKQLARELEIENLVDCRLGDGFAVVGEDDHIDACVIAGIGGLVISKIIAAGQAQARKIGRLYLLPSCDTEALRGYLREHHWMIEEETLILDAGRIYALMCVKEGAEQSPGGIFDLFGYKPVLRGDALAKQLIEKHRAAMEKAYAQICRAGAGESPRGRQLQENLAQTAELLERYF